LMPSNLQLHPAGMNPSSIHVSMLLVPVMDTHCIYYKIPVIV
jgi:hypothetical protein